MNKLIVLLLLAGVLAAILPLPAVAAVTLVPCGRSEAGGKVTDQCTFRDLIVLIIRLVNYLISMAGLVAIFYVMNQGFILMTSVGNPEKIQKARSGISNAIVGLGIIVLAFVFVNLLVNGIFGKKGTERQWWDVNCIVEPTRAGCPFAN